MQQETLIAVKEVEVLPSPPKEGWIDELAGAICDPIIVYPSGGWENSLPDWIPAQIKTDRLIALMLSLTGERLIATDAEALAYIMPRTLVAPLPEHWTKIYCYLGTIVMSTRQVEMPADVREDSLSDYEMGLLKHLKGWIYERRLKARAERRREGRKAEKAEQLACLPEQLSLFGGD